jgi:Mce-associated membrane protein
MTFSQPRDGPAEGRWSAPAPLPAHDPASGVGWYYASWRRRALGFLLDGLIALIAGIVFRSVFRTPDAAPVGELIAVILLQWQQSRTGATVGKRALGMRLLDLEHSTPPMFVTCICRWLLHFLDAIFLIGFLAPLFTRRRQTFADMIARTVVVLA